ncbi:HNH endonuclease [Bacillus paralicheniformis]|uniref:HNH endonuclease n=1 Tax=Bacillus paralicheniformis TaxID=1648923 RepID=UPI0011A26A3B|nr:HNH endonuclease [Bacillus paralicheniformis]TWJ39675.1 ESAT-6 secretion machinery protein EssD [Bacillus paralicheniformis]WMW46478.1 HNH endonuclease [Bacillus paralicheniformis]
MDVKYVPEEWQGMKDGLDALTGGPYGGGMKAGLIKLNDLLEDIESKIKDKDSDRSISFTHTSKKSKIEELFKDYQKLADFCLKAGSLVEDHIDSPFYKKIDAFAEKMRGLTIHNYTTANRIGSKETTYVGYGMSKQAVETDKAKVSVNDIFKDSESFDHVLSKEFEEFQINHPDIELSYEEYMKAIASSRGFEYESIGDVQKNQELWRDLLAGAGIIVLTIFCAPAGLTVAVAYGGANISSAATGKDWMTQRELNTDERVERGVFGALDIIPGAAAAKGTFKSAATIGQISSKTEHMVQSFKDSKNIWANRMKVNGLKAQDRLNDAGFAIKKQFAKSADALSDIARGAEAGAGGTLVRKGSNYSAHVNDAHKASKAKMQDSIQRVEKEIEAGKSVSKGTGNVNLKNIDEFIDGTKTFDDVVDDFARLYSEKIQTNKTWSWNKSFHGGEYLTARQRKLIKEKAIADGLIPNVNVIKADGMRYGFADFKGAGLVVETKDLPESLWLKSDEAQFEWLDNAIGGRPEGMTWHHTEVPGKMELVPFGIHNITIHNGGRSTGMWADAPR